MSGMARATVPSDPAWQKAGSSGPDPGRDWKVAISSPPPGSIAAPYYRPPGSVRLVRALRYGWKSDPQSTPTTSNHTSRASTWTTR